VALCALLLAAWAAILVRLPQTLITEAAGRAPDRRRQLLAMCLLAIAGFAALLLLPLDDLPERTALAAAGMCALALAYVDLRLLVIPDLYSLGLAALGLTGPLSPGLATALIGGLASGGLVLAVYLAWRFAAGREGMGLGDVKLAFALGCLLGAQPALEAIAVAALLGAAAGLAMRRVRRKRDAPDAELIPFGAGLGLSGLGFLCWSWLR
jgi:prepilin signal peptidase PulO-like enzyme (type II secretory pathway)